MPPSCFTPYHAASAYTAAAASGAKLPHTSAAVMHAAASIRAANTTGAPPRSMALYWLVVMGRSVSTASAAQAREATGTSASGHRAMPSADRNTDHCPSASSTMQITAKAPQWESFRMRCRVSISRRLITASHTSIKPSRCMKPVTSHGAAAHSSAPMGRGRKPPSHAHSAHTPPAISPTSGRHASMRRRALSLHIFFGQGIARNMPHAMKKP